MLCVPSLLSCSNVLLNCIKGIEQCDGVATNRLHGSNSWDQTYLTKILTRFIDETFGGIIQMLGRNNYFSEGYGQHASWWFNFFLFLGVGTTGFILRFKIDPPSTKTIFMLSPSFS